MSTQDSRGNAIWFWGLGCVALAVIIGGVLWLAGWAVVVDTIGQVESASVLSHDGQEQPLRRLSEGYFAAMVESDGSLVARCVTGEEVGHIYVSWLLDGELRDPCPPSDYTTYAD